MFDYQRFLLLRFTKKYKRNNKNLLHKIAFCKVELTKKCM